MSQVPNGTIAATMAVTQAQVDALNAAIASGTRSVTLGAQTITYNTIASLIQARDDLLKQLQAQEAATAGKRRSKQMLLFQADRGYR